ncbi:actin-binding protein-like [Clupea harengus]|uniref:Actin-binding protein-like n=1 Tax=Clupea harengus TaxID=7950 RepID=A0A6P8GTF5_CLUHA|nr:actin-binding protein-like [Clupea harengus]
MMIKMIYVAIYSLENTVLICICFCFFIATQLNGSSQWSSPSNSSTQGGQNIPLGEDINKVLSLLKLKSQTTAKDPAKPPIVPPPQGNQSGPPMKLLPVPIFKNGEKPSEKADKDAKGLPDTPSTSDLTESLAKHAGKVPSSRSSLVPEDGAPEGPAVVAQNGRDLKQNGRGLKGSFLDVDGPDDRSESLAEDSRPVNASSLEQENQSQPREVPTQGEAPDCNIEEPEEDPSLDAAVATDRAEQQCADEAAAAALTSEESSKEAVCAALLSSLVVENGVPKPRRGRPPKQAKAAPSLPEAKTRPPPPQKVKHSPRLHPEGRQLRSRSPALGRAHTRRGQRRGRK